MIVIWFLFWFPFIPWFHVSTVFIHRLQLVTVYWSAVPTPCKCWWRFKLSELINFFVTGWKTVHCVLKVCPFGTITSVHYTPPMMNEPSWRVYTSSICSFGVSLTLKRTLLTLRRRIRRFPLNPLAFTHSHGHHFTTKSVFWGIRFPLQSLEDREKRKYCSL